jgi:hypothetical protein
MKANDERRIPRKETFIWRKMPDGIIEIEGTASCYLNPIGAKIWELINERNTVADIIKIMQKSGNSSGKSETEMSLWINDYLDDLEKKGLISYDTGIWGES